MKKAYSKYIIISCMLMFIAGSQSCKKEWLDKKPDISTVIPASLQDAQALLDNGSIMNAFSPVLAEIASGDIIVTESRFNTAQGIERNAYTWSRAEPFRDVGDWFGSGNNNGSYARVFYCNLVLEALNKFKASNSAEQDEWNNIKGQALFQRSRTFYELAQLFAPPYQSSAADSDLGIPLRLETDINIPSVRATVKQTYDQVINDLLEAKSLLPVQALYKTRASKTAVFGLLARIYLSMEEYEKAGAYADSCLRNHSVLLNLDAPSFNSGATYPFALFNEEVIFHSTLNNYAMTALGNVNPDLVSLYETNDIRRIAFFGTNASGATFKGGYAGSRLCFNGLSSNEQYLIRAECYARAGKITEALKDLNDLLRTRWSKVGGLSTYIDKTATDTESALKQILLERKKELPLRGLRWSDLRRLNKDDRFKTTLTRTIGGKTYTLEPNSYKYTFPIPDDIIEMTGMPQNVGW